MTPKRLCLSIIVLAGLATPALAQDVQLSTAELRQLITGKTVSFSGGGRATYHADGRYVFRGGGTFEGRYRIANNQVCVDFPQGNRRCDRYVRRGNNYYLINFSGRRYRATIR